MNMERVKEIANAVLYEGYLLYPYRHSAIKNRQRWTIGVVYPREYSEANGGIEPWMMQTECLVTGQEGADTFLDISVRFLHLLMRKAEPSQAVNATVDPNRGSVAFTPDAWEEGVEREVMLAHISLRELVTQSRDIEITFPAVRMVEQGEHYGMAAEIVREQQSITGCVVLSATSLGANLFKLRVQIENWTPGTGIITNLHQAILLHSFVSTHAILRVQQGTFVSLLEPPEALQQTAQGCQNLHTWPVLVGEEGECDTMLSSPIILYDYPQIAPESAGPLFDGTEIDEILTLRIMTLTDEEKQEMRQGDERAREILERTENLTPEQFMKMHGVIRSLRPVGEAESMVQEGQV
ncbi:MAG: hypothetical protein ABI406_02520 [Ktedonobacteraceae bacterium]